jgi:hypothetical protein
MSGFEICSGCGRHVRVEDGACPFCRAAVSTVRAEPWWGVRLAAALPLLLGVACDDAKKPEPVKAEPVKADEKKAEPMLEQEKADDAGAKAHAPDEHDADAKAEGDDPDAKAEGDDPDDPDAKGEGDDPDDGGAKADDGPVGVTTPEGDSKLEDDGKVVHKPKYGAARPDPDDRKMTTKYGGPPRPAMKYGSPPKPDDDPL